MIKIVLVLMSVAAIFQVVSSAPGAHSVEKRQTTVTFTSKYEDIRELVINIVVAFTFSTLAVVVLAPLFGYKLDLLVSTFNDIAPAADESVTSPVIEGSAYGAYPTGGRNLQGQAWTDLGVRLISSINILDATFNYMDIDSDMCQLKTVCEMESYAANNPITRLAINTVNSNLRGLEKYSEAVEAGLSGQDCSLLYDQCGTSYFGY